MFKLKLPLLRQEQGFTLVEVLVAILITTLFVAAAMQAVVIAAVFKARARQYAETTVWIQEDVENVKRKAAQLKYATLTAAAGTGDKILQVISVDGFAKGDTLTVGTDVTSNVISSINPSATPPTLTLSLPLDTEQSEGAVVVATNPCKASSSTAGFGESLKQNLPPLSNSGTKPVANKSYTLTRNLSVGGTTAVSGTCTANACYDLLQLTYEVKHGSESPIATMYTEVIPDAAFQCP